LPTISRYGKGEFALATLVLGRKLDSLIRERALASWEAYCEKYGLDLVIFDQALDESPRANDRSPAWQKCLVADSEVLRRYSAVCWVDADIIINAKAAKSVFAFVPVGKIGAVEAWASPTAEVYRRFLESYKRRASDAERAETDDQAADYYSRFGLPSTYATVVQSGVVVFSPALHGAIFRDVYDRYEDRGTPSWHYEMRPLSYELHRQTAIEWLDPRFNYNAICDVVEIQGRDWPNHFSVLDKIVMRTSWLPFWPIFYRSRFQTLEAALERAWFLHFAGFRFGLLLASHSKFKQKI
jgi:hypothetical protein